MSKNGNLLFFPGGGGGGGLNRGFMVVDFKDFCSYIVSVKCNKSKRGKLTVQMKWIYENMSTVTSVPDKRWVSGH